MQIPVSFADQQKLSAQAHIDNIHISFFKNKKQKHMRANCYQSFKWICVNGVDKSL